VLREALAIQRKSLGNNNPEVAITLKNLTGVLNMEGKFDEAEVALQEALRIQAAQPSESPDMADSLSFLADIFASRADFVAAEKARRESLVISRRIYGSEHPIVSLTLMRLALDLENQNNFPAARIPAEEAASSYLHHPERGEPAIRRDCYDSFARVLIKLNDTNALETLYLDELKQGEATHQSDSDSAILRFRLAELLSKKGKTDEAQRMYREFDVLDQNLLPSRKPDVDHANLRRLLGSEYAIRNEWQKAADNFSILLQVNVTADDNTRQLDFLRYGPVLIELGDTNRYQQFVRAVIADYASNASPVTAERICRICLLRPAEEKALRQLAALSETAARTQNETKDSIVRAWSGIAVGLVEYRQGHYSKAAESCSLSLGNPRGGDGPWGAALHIVRSMAYQKLHRDAQARADLGCGREMIETAFKNRLYVHHVAIESSDWLFARILLQEASLLVESQPATKSPAAP
jgi:tetratricopeptide (TPR) repeat protein